MGTWSTRTFIKSRKGKKGVGRGHIVETKSPQNNIFEEDAVTKSGDNAGVRTSDWSVCNPKIGSQHYHQPLDKEGLFTKTAMQLVARQPRKGGRRSKSEREGEGRHRYRKTPDDEEAMLYIYFLIHTCSAWKGRQQGRCRPRLGRRDLYGSSEGLKNCWWWKGALTTA